MPSTSIPLSLTNWTAIGPATIDGSGSNPYTGRISGVSAHPTDANIIYVATAGGGVWKTINATAANPAWTPLTDSQSTLFMGGIAVAPSNPSVIYAGTGESTNSLFSYYGRGVLVSTDAGVTWTLRTAGGAFDRKTISNVVVDPTNPNVAYVGVAGGGVNGVGGNNGVWKTSDGGVTWTNTTSGSFSTGVQYSDVAIDPSTPATVYAAIGSVGGSSSNGVIKTTNGGSTWTALGGGITTGLATGNTKIAVAKSNSQVVYVSQADPGTGGVYRVWRTDNGGTSWTNITPPAGQNYMGGQGWYDSTIIVDPSNAATVYVAGTAGSTAILKSTNSGASWSAIVSGVAGSATPHPDHHGMAFDANGKLINGNDGGVWRLNNPNVGSISWGNLNGKGGTGLNITQFVSTAIHPTNPNLALGGTQDNGTNRFNDGFNWTMTDGGDGGIVLYDFNNPNNAYHIAPVGSFGTANFVRRSTNGGQSWSSMASGITNPNNTNFYPPLVMDPSNPNRLLMGSNVVNVNTNPSGGGTWGKLAGDIMVFSANIDLIAVAKSDPNTIYVSEGNRFWVTTNNGEVWTQKTIPTGGTVSQIVVDPFDSQRLYAIRSVFGGAHVLLSTNGGGAWTNISSNLPNIPTWSFALNTQAAGTSDDIYYVGTDTGTYVSSNQGGSWAVFGAGLPNVQVVSLEYNNSLRILGAGTHGRGLWEIYADTPPTITLPGGAVTFVAGGPAVFLDTGAFVTDPDDPDFNGGTLTIDYTANGNSNDVLAINHQGNGTGQIGVSGSNVSYSGTVIGTFSGGGGTTPLVVTFNASCTPTAAQALIRNITFSTATSNPSLLDRTVRFVITDGLAASAPATKIVHVQSNQPPVLANIESGAINYNENDGATQITAAMTLTDNDSANMASALVAISAGFNSAQDVLSFSVSGTSITGNYDSSTGKLTFSGADTRANYQTVMRSVKFFNTSEDPTTSKRTVTFTVNDGENNSNAQQRDINVASVNDAPTLANIESSTLTAYSQGTPKQVTANITDGDVDSAKMANAKVSITGNFTVGQDDLTFSVAGTAISGNYNSLTGVLSFTGLDTLANYETVLRWVKYANTSATPVTLQRTVTFVINDGALDSNTQQRKIDVIQNAPPTVGAGGPYTIFEGDPLSLSGTGNDADGDTLTFSWDINGDGTFGDATGKSPTLTWAQLNALGIVDGSASFNNVRLRVDDAHDHTVTSSATTLTVNNKAPTIALTGNNSVAEGASYTLNLGAITDPGSDTVTAYKINWGDGAFDSISGHPSGQAKTHTYADGANNYTITVDLTDEDGTHTSAGTKGVTINDVDPTIALTGNASVNEGSSYSLTLGAITDPGADTVTGYTINWGDGKSDAFSGVPSGAKSHTYADGPNNFTITVDLTDEDGTHKSAGSKDVTVNNVAPTIGLTGNATVNEGSSYSLTLGAITDPGSDTVTSYKINWGDGLSDTFSAVPSGSPSHTYADGPNNYTITVDLTDDDGEHKAAGSKAVTIDDVAPTIAVSGNATVNEGASYALTLGAVTDPGSDTVTGYKINWGDGTNDSFTGVPSGDKTHTYADGPNAYTITVDLTNEDGTFKAAGSKNVTVNDVAPTITLTGSATINEGSSYSLTIGAVNDPGADPVSGYTINWGDGTSENFSGDPSGLVKAHTYADGPNGYTITIDLTNDDGAFKAAGSKSITVNDVDPTIALTGNANVNEGSSYSLTFGAITDPGQDTVTGYSIDWGDGTSENFSGNPSGQVKTHTYADGPTDYTIKVDLTDEDGTHSGVGLKSVTIDNVAPSIVVSGNAAVNEGSSYALKLGAITDPGQDAVTGYTINWGDGSSDSFSGDPTGKTKSHTYADGPKNYTITVDLTDEDGTHTGSGSKAMTVDDVAPTIALTGNATVNEGSSYSVTLGTVSDPGTDTVNSYKINWGDGTTDNFAGNPNGQVKAHTYADGPKNYTITIDLTNEDATFVGAGSKSITINDVAPTIALTGNASVNEGSSYSLTLGAITDPGTDTVTSYKVNWGDGTTESFTGNPAGQVKSHTYADGPNSYNIQVELTDEDGIHANAGTKNVSVNNVAPTITVTGNATTNEGSLYSITLGTVSDPGQDTVTGYKINWGDGLSDTFSGSPNGQVKTHTYADGTANVTITVELTDEDGAHASAGSKSLTVNNVAPTISITGNASVNEGSSYSLTLGAITDPGTDTVSSYKINWGDGQFDTFSGNATGQVKSHTYADGPKNYTITVDLTDEDGAFAGAGSKGVSIDDVAPTIALSGATTTNEGSSYSLTLGAITDPGADTVTSYKINWGDGLFDNFTGHPTGQIKSHTYADGPNNYTVTVDLTNEDGTFAAAGSKPITVNDVAPTITLSGPSSTNEGSTYLLSFGSITDPGQDTVTAYTVNWGDGTSNSFSGLPFGFASHTYADGPNNYTITVDLTDEDGLHTGSGSKPITVNNVAPTIDVGGALTADEGATFTLTLGAITDPGQDTVTQWIVRWGDGQSDTYTIGGSHTHTYADGSNNYTIHVDLVDEDGTHLDAGTRPITVQDVPPTIALSGNAVVAEGSIYSLTLGAITDPGQDTVTSYTINWGDGSSDSFSGHPTGQVKTHVYADGPNIRVVSVDLTDEDGPHAAAGSKSITVNDVAPTIALSGNATVNEGSVYSLNLGAIVDPGVDTVTNYQINWGDGTSDFVFAHPTGQVNTHTYADGPNNYTITVDLTDEDGTHASAGSKSVTVNDVPPTIAISGNASVNEGATYTLNLGTITDPGQDTVTQWIVHWGDGKSNTYATDGNQTHTYADGPSDHAVTVDLVNEDGTHTNAANAFSVHINNVAPTGTFSDDGAKREHRATTIKFTNQFDPSPVDTAAGFRYSFDWNNDGDFLDQDELLDSTTSTASHVFHKDGAYIVRGRIKDKDDDATTYTITVTVLNADLFIAGTGGTVTGTVRAFDSLSGAQRFELVPFGTTHKYGVMVANGDVTGDLIPDIVVGMGAGSKTTVKVYDGFDGTELLGRQFDAFPSTTTSGVSLAVADVNGDGFADIVVGAGPYGAPNVLVVSGKDGTQLAKFAGHASGMYGVRVAAGDVTGDGKADIIAAPVSGTNPVRIFDGATFKLLRSITPFGSFSGGLFVSAGDLTGDGKAEVIVSQDSTANAKVRVYNGNTGAMLSEFTPFAGVSPQPQGARIMLVDRDGDGKLDIVVGSGPSGKGRIRTFNGATLALMNEVTPFDPNFLGGVFVG